MSSVRSVYVLQECALTVPLQMIVSGAYGMYVGVLGALRDKIRGK